jgi:hypothetical protein
MTADQLAIGDCDPAWMDNDEALAILHDLIPPQYWDLRGQGATAMQLHTMTTIDLKGSYL